MNHSVLQTEGQFLFQYSSIFKTYYTIVFILLADYPLPGSKVNYGNYYKVDFPD